LPARCAGRLIHLALDVVDLDAAISRVTAAGGVVREAAEERDLQGDADARGVASSGPRISRSSTPADSSASKMAGAATA
jgi:hypothetical protein